MKAKTFRTWGLVGCGAALGLAACNQVLDIEQAQVDPRLTAAASASGAPSAGSGSAQGGSDAKGGAGAVSGVSGAGTGGSEHQHAPGGAGTPAADGGEAGAVSTGGSSGITGAGTGATHEDHSGHGSSGEAGSAGESTSGPPDPCDEYCALMDTECVGEAAQYRDEAQCLRICHLLPAGEKDGPDENSVACRLKYAQKTHYGNGTEVTVYCREAGPSGDGRCGSACDGFCSLMETVCTEETAGSYHFQSDQDCLTTCKALPAPTVSYSSSDPLVSDGNHALCRLFHVASAAMADADEHCEHAMGVTLCQATQ